ncbi:hypothetical protein SAMN05518670_3075 [Paenibacillus sp. OK076]|nr:hypothetical protein SAMN05518670_3075 [Paenibacillus sp. OK076]
MLVYLRLNTEFVKMSAKNQAINGADRKDLKAVVAIMMKYFVFLMH